MNNPEDFKVNSIFLTEKGKKMILAAFPLAAIRYADTNFDMQVSKKGPWVTFRELCIAYCQERNLKVYYDYIRACKTRMMIEEESDAEDKTPVWVDEGFKTRPQNPNYYVGSRHGVFTILSELPKIYRKTRNQREFIVVCNYNKIHAKILESLNAASSVTCHQCHTLDPNKVKLSRQPRLPGWRVKKISKVIDCEFCGDAGKDEEDPYQGCRYCSKPRPAPID